MFDQETGQPAEAPTTLVTVCNEMTDDIHAARGLYLATIGLHHISGDDDDAYVLSELAASLEARLRERQAQVEKTRTAGREPGPTA